MHVGYSKEREKEWTGHKGGSGYTTSYLKWLFFFLNQSLSGQT